MSVFKRGSVQDLETRVQMLEEAIGFVMSVTTATIQVSHPLDPGGPKLAQITLDKLFTEVKLHGGKIVPVDDILKGAGVGSQDQGPGEQASTEPILAGAEASTSGDSSSAL